MDQEEALKQLRNRLSSSGIDQSAAEYRRSRSGRNPLDATPETFMGASVGAKPEEATASPAEGDGGDGDGGRRRGKARRTRAARAFDVSSLAGEFSLGSSTPPVTREASPKDRPLPVPPAESAQAPREDFSRERSQLQTKIEGLEQQLANLKIAHSDEASRLEDYDDLCEELVEGKPKGARSMAEFIGKLYEADEQAKEYKQRCSKLGDQVSQLRKDVEEARNAAKEEGRDSAGIDEARLQEAEERVRESESELDEAREKLSSLEADNQRQAKEIDELKAKLEVASASAASAMPLGYTDGDQVAEEAAEESIIAAAEKELKMMDDLIKEQDAYLSELEKDVSTDRGVGSEM